MITPLHPNLVKRGKRVCASMIGKYANYYPNGITANHNLKYGTTVQILDYEISGGKDKTLVTVRDSSGNRHTVFFKDLGFIRREKKISLIYSGKTGTLFL